MATESHMRLPIGTPVPSFHLPDVTTGGILHPGDFSSAKGLLVVFLCCHCPYVIHVRAVLNTLASEFQNSGLATVGISSNDPVSYPDDAPPRLAEMIAQHKLCFPVLFDETQEVARAFDAACTPDFFLFDQEQKLFYRGRMDDSTPGNGRRCTGKDLREAIVAVLAGESPPGNQQPAMGCSIKWRA
jgi:peroxiredoxin